MVHEHMVSSYEANDLPSFGVSDIPENLSLGGYDIYDYRSIVDYICTLNLSRNRLCSHLKDICNFNEEQIDDYITIIEEELKKKGYRWGDLDLKSVDIKDSIEDFYKKTPEHFEAAYLKLPSTNN